MEFERRMDFIDYAKNEYGKQDLYANCYDYIIANCPEKYEVRKVYCYFNNMCRKLEIKDNHGILIADIYISIDKMNIKMVEAFAIGYTGNSHLSIDNDLILDLYSCETGENIGRLPRRGRERFNFVNRGVVCLEKRDDMTAKKIWLEAFKDRLKANRKENKELNKIVKFLKSELD